MDIIRKSKIRNDEGKNNSRKRVPSSCYMCRVKKSKCDRLKPHCSNCVSKNIKHLCKYEEPLWEKNSPEEIERNKLLAEIEFLKNKVKILEERSSSFSINNKETTSDLVISDSSILNSLDSFNSIADRRSSGFNFFAVKNLKLRYFGMSSYMFILLNDPYSYRTFEGYLQSQIKISQELKGSKSEMDVDQSTLKLASSTQITESFSLKSNDDSLPSPFIMKVLVNRFINYCHHLVPFVSSNALNEILDLIIRQGTNDLNLLSIRYPSETVILVLALRFATLTLPLKSYFDKKLTSPMNRFIDEVISSKGTISPSHIAFINKVVLSMNSFKKADILRLKASLFLYIYKVFSPEDEENSSDLSVLFGMIIQMGRIIGLHKYYEGLTYDVIEDQESRDRRIILSYLFYYDSRQSFRMGVPLLLSEEKLWKNILTEQESKNSPNNRTSFEYFKIQEKLTSLQRKSVNSMNGEYFTCTEDTLNSIVKEMESLLLYDLRDLELTFKVKSIKSLDNTMERVQFIYFKTELLFDMYIIYSAQYVICNTISNKDRYLSLAFGKALLVMKNGYKFAKGETSDFFSEYETLYATGIWIPMLKILPLVCVCLNRLQDGSYSLSEFYNYTNPVGIRGLLEWSLLDFTSDKAFCASIYGILDELYQSSVRLSASFLSCFKATLILRTILDYFYSNFPELNSDMHTERVFYSNNADDQKIQSDHFLEDFFESQANSAVLDFEFFTNSLNNDLSPFLVANFESLDALVEDQNFSLSLANPE